MDALVFGDFLIQRNSIANELLVQFAGIRSYLQGNYLVPLFAEEGVGEPLLNKSPIISVCQSAVTTCSPSDSWLLVRPQQYNSTFAQSYRTFGNQRWLYSFYSK